MSTEDPSLPERPSDPRLSDEEHLDALISAATAVTAVPRDSARRERLWAALGGTLPARDAGLSRWGPRALVGAAVVFGLIALRAERIPTAYPNDSSVHSLTVAFATRQIAAGHFPLDGWFPFLSLGSPFFLHYQSFSAVLTGLLGNIVTAPQAFSWSGYLLLSFWPVSVYLGARLFDLDRWSAAAAAAAAPVITNGVVGYGFEHEAYIFYGSGLWSQLWGMVTLPIALGLAWRAISRRQNVAYAGVSLGVVIIFHFLTAYLAGLAVVVFVILRPTKIVQRARRAAVVGGIALLTASFVLVPLVSTANWAATNEFEEHTYFDDSYGARQVLSWLFHGQILDAGRFPVVSIFAAIGFVASLFRWRKDERVRALVGVFLLSLVLYFGRTTWGSLVDILPDNSDLLFHRYVMGVQLFGVIFAGIGIATVGRGAISLAQRGSRFAAIDGRSTAMRAVGSVAAIALVIGLLEPGWREVAAYDGYSGISIEAQQIADASQGAAVDALIAKAEALGGGRIFAGLPNSPGDWAFNFRVGSVPVYIYLADRGVDAVGFTLRTSSLTTDPEVYFNESSPAEYELFGIHYLLYPTSRAPSVPATLIESLDGYDLYSLSTVGYIHVVDTSGSIVANSTNLGAAEAFYLTDGLADRGIFDSVAFGGRPAGAPTANINALPTTSPGSVTNEIDNLDQGEASATVDTTRTAVVILSASFDPGWQVTVDGRPATPEMIVPAIVGVTVGPGTHTISFRYQSYRWYPELIAISVITIAAAVIYERRRRRRANATPRDVAPSTAPPLM